MEISPQIAKAHSTMQYKFFIFYVTYMYKLHTLSDTCAIT